MINPFYRNVWRCLRPVESAMRAAVDGTLRVINKALPKSLAAIAIREDFQRTYAKFLLPCITALNLDKRGVDRIELLAPPSLCRHKDGNSGNDGRSSYLATSSLLALYDEMDAHAFLSRDRTGRGGVSVELTFDLYEEIQPWTRLILELKTEKIGKFMGFSTVEVKDSRTGNVVARGQHTKFLHHGWWWNIMHGPVLGPILYDFYYQFRYHKFTTPLDGLLRGRADPEATDAFVRQYPIFQTNEEIFHSNFSSFHLRSNVYTYETEDADIGDKVLSHMYSLNILPQTKNYLGVMHGGGVAAAIEQACYLFKFHGQENAKNRSHLRLARMHIKYMNATRVSS